MRNIILICKKVRRSFPLIAIPLIFFFILTSSVSAIGITPSSVTVNFEPNKEDFVNFCVINNEGKNMPIRLYVRGDLAEYVELSADEAVLNPSERLKCFTFHYKLPSDLPGGSYDTRIGASETVPPEIAGGVGITTLAAVEQLFVVNAPYSGKRVSIFISMQPEKPNVFDTVVFTITAKSMGTETATFSGTLYIYDSKDQEIATLSIPETMISSMAVKFVKVMWDGTEIGGNYRAVAIINYDGKTAQAEREFVVGETVIKINEIRANDIKQGNIGKIEVDIESFWSETINDIITEITIKDHSSGEIVDTITLDPFSIGAWAKKTLTAYWDTANVPIGTYDLEVKIRYEDNVVQGSDQIKVVGEISLSVLIILPIVAIIIVLLFVILWLLKKKGSIETKEKSK